MSNKGLTYGDAGVDIDRGARAVERIKGMARSTFDSNVLSDLGSFGGLYRPNLKGLIEPVLVASTDGVGTKLRVASLVGRHDTVGEDLVNHCVNDILVQGARPLFFLDYFAADRLDPDIMAAVVDGIARGCRACGAALLGGETAELPGIYQPGEYDVAGTIVGIVDRDRVIDGRTIQVSDALLGLPSNGLHTNGYSLARMALFEVGRLSPNQHIDELAEPLGEALLRTHTSYLEALLPAIERGVIKGLAHITGGGITDNLPRVLPKGMAASIDRSTWQTPPLFRLIQECGSIAESEMYRTFNMGVGMIAAVSPGDSDRLLTELEGSFIIGEVTSGDGTVHYTS